MTSVRAERSGGLRAACAVARTAPAVRRRELIACLAARRGRGRPGVPRQPAGLGAGPHDPAEAAAASRVTVTGAAARALRRRPGGRWPGDARGGAGQPRARASADWHPARAAWCEPGRVGVHGICRGGRHGGEFERWPRPRQALARSPMAATRPPLSCPTSPARHRMSRSAPAGWQALVRGRRHLDDRRRRPGRVARQTDGGDVEPVRLADRPSPPDPRRQRCWPGREPGPASRPRR